MAITSGYKRKGVTVSNDQQESMQNALMSIRQHQDILIKKQKRQRDPYGIQNMDDIDKILALLRNRKLEKTLNDYIFAFLRITEITENPYFSNIIGLQEILENIIIELERREEPDPIIGRLSLAFKRANFFNNKKIWIELCDHILEDRFDPDEEEIYAAIQGFYHLQKRVQEEWQLRVVQNTFKKLSAYGILNLKQKKYNLRTLCVLTKYMVLNRHYDQSFYFEVEFVLKNHMQNMSMDLQTFLLENRCDKISLPNYARRNDPPTLLIEEFSNFGYYFATVDYSSEMLFHFLQAWILEGLSYSDRFAVLRKQREEDIEDQKRRFAELQKEIDEIELQQKLEDYSKFDANELRVELDILLKQKSLYNEEEILHELQWPLKVHGNVVANLIQYFNFIHSKNPGLSIDNRIRQWLLSTSKNPEFEYTVENLYNIHKAMHQLEIENEEEYNIFLENKLFEYQYQMEDHVINLEHIKNYIEIRAVQEQGGDFQKINQRVYEFLDDMCKYRMKQFDSFSIMLFTQMCELENIMNEFPKFLAGLPHYVNENIDFYDFEELCYFCLICHDNSQYLNLEDSATFWSAINLMKEHIKISTYSRGFKIDMESNFTKLLTKLDMAEFFSGGEGSY